MGLPFRFACATLAAAAALGAGAAMSASAQSSTAVDLSPSLLPQSFGDWKQSSTASAGQTSALSLSAVSKEALEEDKPERSQVVDYTRNGRSLHVEAIQFEDRTGAYSAYTLVKRADMHEGKELGSFASVGEGSVLFTEGASIVLVSPATAADLPLLKPLAEALPKPVGNKGVAPLLPTFVPETGLVNGSVRYAVGPASYAAQGGVLPANSIRWDASAEAVTAQYADKRGKETLTLLLYPTPDIARRQADVFNKAIAGMGPNFINAKLRQELELVILADGSFVPDQAQKMIENIHMRQVLSFDKDVQPVFHVEVQKTASLLLNIAALFGILATAAVLLGIFLGGGRALVRVMRGKSAAVEPEFLSLHLDTPSKPVHFGN